MSESAEAARPGTQEVEALVSRIVAQIIDPLRGELTTVGRALSILADRMPAPEQSDLLARRIDALAARMDDAPTAAALADLERTVTEGLAQVAARPDLEERLDRVVAALEAPLGRDAEERGSQTDELRQALAVAVAHAVAKVEQARTADTTRLGEQVAALQEAMVGVVEARQTEADELRTKIAETVEQAIGRIEAARSADGAAFQRHVEQIESAHAADATRMAEQVAALQGPLPRDGIAGQTQLDDLRQTLATTIDQTVDRIESARAADAARVTEQVAALMAGAEADARRRDLQAVALLAAVDDRLQSLHRAGTEADDARESRLAARLEAVSVEQGKALLAHLDERTAAITELHSIPAIVAAEVRNATAAALTSQVQPLVDRLVEAIDALAHEEGRIEAMARAHAGEARAVEERVATLFLEVAERAESAVDHSRARIVEGQVALATRFDVIVGELLSTLSGTVERLEARMSESTEALRGSSGHQNAALLDAVNRSSQQVGEGLTALVVEQVGARDAQLTAIEFLSSRIDEVGPVVARALLPEVERSTRAAHASEEAVASLEPEALRSAFSDASDEIRSAVSHLDETIAALAGEMASAGTTALEDLRASQSLLREAVQEGTHEARLAALDIRALRDRLTPHLVALAEATTRRADADQAGFDAVLARLDQLLAARQR